MESAKNIPREEEMYISRKCWFKVKKKSSLALYTPFVVGMASGTLKMETFMSYIAHDPYYFKAFAKA